jgi:O-antigen/teichoic acid export membrane protein
MLVFNMDAILTRLLLFSILLGVPITAVLSISFGALGAATGSVITAALILVAMWSILHSKRMLFWQGYRSQTPALADTSCAIVD